MSKRIRPIADTPAVLFTLLVTFLIALPHVIHIPHSIFAFFVVLLIYRLLGVRKASLLPGKPVLFLITVCGLLLLFFEHRTVLGLHAGTSFFIVTLALKILELKQVRDLYLIIFLCFFVAITQFLYTQSILMGWYILLTTGLLVAALIGLTTGTLLTIKQRLKLSGLLLLQAIPIMIILFLLFPRIPAPRIGLPTKTSAAQTGLSDSMQPGQISQLIRSPELAFRVNFKGDPPPPRDRYWRGPVFWHTDGIRWTGVDNPSISVQPIQLSGPQFRYDVTLEPHRQKWLFALDLPANKPPGSTLTPELLLIADKTVVKRISYSLISFTQYNTGTLKESERKLGLQLPGTPPPRITDLVSSWRTPGAGSPAIVQKALDYFHQEAFYYTRSPPLYPRDPVESFLFDSKRGFCEHFASAFVYLMRAAKIPARIVTGYQGGELNTVGQFLEIRQSDAHAWAEVWFQNRGWVRIDPTSAVAPERIERGFNALAENNASSFGLDGLNLLGSGGLFQNLRFAWATLDHAWHQWVISYNAVSQNDFLSKFGLEDLKSLLFTLIGTIAACLLVTALAILRPDKPKLDKALRLYFHFCRKLAKTGIRKQANEGAGDFAHRAIKQHPNLGPDILQITGLYHKIRYGRLSSTADLNDLERAIRSLHLRRHI